MEVSRSDARKNIWQNVIVYLFFLIYYILYFRIVCSSSLSADDMWNSNIWSSVYTGQDPAWSVVRQQFPIWLHMGRFFPFSNLAPFIYMMLPSVFLYKLAIVLTTYLDNLVCSLCIRDLTENRVAGYLYMLLFPILIQLTPEYDSGLYCYHMLIQSVVLFGFLSVWGLIKYTETDKKRYAAVSCISFLIALGTYEVAFVYIFVLVYAAYKKTGNIKRMFRYLMPDCIIFLIMCAANVIVRRFFQTAAYDGITVNLDIKAVIITLLKQCSTCVPLGRYICVGIRKLPPYSDIYTYSISQLIGRLTAADLIVLAIYIMMLVYLLYQIRKMPENVFFEKKVYMPIIVCGLIIWIIPGSLIAISSKYQQILGWCSGHLPAFMQSFGFTMLTAGLLIFLFRVLKNKIIQRTLFCCCGLLSSIILLLSQISGRDAVEFMNTFRKYPQENISYASRAGILDDFEDCADRMIVGTTCYIYDQSASRQFYTKFAHKNIYAEERQIFIDSVIGTDSSVPYNMGMDDEGRESVREYDLAQMDREYYGMFNMADHNSGALILGKYTELDYNEESGSVEHIWIEEPLIYIRGDGKELAGVDTSNWILVRSEQTYDIYRLTDIVDILQDTEYYSSEMGQGILYRNVMD